MNFINAQVTHPLQSRFAIILGQMGLGDGLYRVPTQERQFGHVAHRHHPAQAIHETAQRFGVVRVRRTKGGAISKMD